MPRTPARFTQADLARAIRAIKQTDAAMVVEIGRDGVMRIIPATAKELSPVDEPEDFRL